MTVWPLLDPGETLGENAETGLEALPLAFDLSDSWEAPEETETEADFFDPDLLDLYRQLRAESPEIVSEEEEYTENFAEMVSEQEEYAENSGETVREQEKFLDNSVAQVNRDLPVVSVVSRSFQEIDGVNLIAARQLLRSGQAPPPKIQGIRQGDLLIMPLTERIAHWFDHEITLPFWRDPTFQKCPDLVLATGQSTGHQHRISQGKADLYQRQGTHYLRVLSAQVVLTHPEHQAVSIPQGLWAVRRQREYDSWAGREQFVRD